MTARTTWFVVACLIVLGASVAVRLGARAPAGADADESRVGTAVEPAKPM
jgi:hypothetical protein